MEQWLEELQEAKAPAALGEAHVVRFGRFGFASVRRIEFGAVRVVSCRVVVTRCG